MSGNPVICESCGDTVIIGDDDDRFTVIQAIYDHMMPPTECYNQVIDTTHGVFCMVDGKLFEEVIF